MKIAICEDELLFQQKLKSGIEHFFAEKKTEIKFDCFVNGVELINNLKNEYDVIFLDINLNIVHMCNPIHTYMKDSRKNT